MVNDITKKIQSTKKYQRLSEDVIQAAVEEAARRYTNPAEIDRKARNILHQIWGAYYYNPPNFKKSLEQLKATLDSGVELKKALISILELHSSTRERIPILDEFYKKIFEITGPPSSIIDHACGLNPLTIPWMNLPPGCTYQGSDIDQKGIAFLQDAFKISDLRSQILTPPRLTQESITESSQHAADVAFFFKCITCLDHLQKNAGLTAIEQQKCNYAVVSFAIKSIKGYEKGMQDFYSNTFENYLSTHQWQYHKRLFSTELVYIVHKTA